jgi:hypothetical protein
MNMDEMNTKLLNDDILVCPECNVPCDMDLWEEWICPECNKHWDESSIGKKMVNVLSKDEKLVLRQYILLNYKVEEKGTRTYLMVFKSDLSEFDKEETRKDYDDYCTSKYTCKICNKQFSPEDEPGTVFIDAIEHIINGCEAYLPASFDKLKEAILEYFAKN